LPLSKDYSAMAIEGKTKNFRFLIFFRHELRLSKETFYLRRIKRIDTSRWKLFGEG